MVYDLKSAAIAGDRKTDVDRLRRSWCVYCRSSKGSSEPSYDRQIHQQDVHHAVHLDSEKDQRAVQILEVKSLPTTVILSPEADLLGSVEGFVKARDFASVLKQSVDFQKTLRAESPLALGSARK